tara:strand:+ start:9860 stop:10468 length:609 start_codon:yes stop_codon:yes gene_type:complete
MNTGHPVLDLIHSERVEIPPEVERGAKSPYASVEYEVTPGHIHHVPMSNGVDYLGIEEGAELLGEAILACNEDRHNGHGRKHAQGDADAAYKSAIEQLLTRRYDQEWVDLQQKIRAYKRWGGHPPTAVMMPTQDDVKRWQMLVTTLEGTPHLVGIKESFSADMNELMEPPDSSNSVKAPIGHYRNPKWSLNRRIAWLNSLKG